MFRAVLYAFHYHDPFVHSDDISRGAPREWRWRLVHDVSTNTPGSPAHHPYAWVLEPELEHCPHAVPPCLLRLLHTHAPLRFSEAETQTPSPANISEFKLAFCMITL